MAPRVAIRQKVVVIPYTFHPYTGEKMYVMIQDKESKDWSFVTGGKKMKESYEEAAIRELTEETKGVLLDMKTTFLREVGSVATDFRPPKHKKQDREQNLLVRTLYRIYELPVRFQHDLRILFRQVPMSDNDETSDICYMTEEKILCPRKHQEIKRIWTLVHDELAPFYFQRANSY